MSHPKHEHDAKGKESAEPASDAALQAALPKCGIVMPISTMGDRDATHWAEVLTIISDAVHTVGFEASLVSASDKVSVIHSTIVQNLYENPIVVCDVSGQNPNVMFELGMRLTFDKPVVIIKDDDTSFNFDTSPVEHLTYRRDLRFSSIIQFKELLASKVKATVEAAKDKQYSPFLRHFTFSVLKAKKLDTEEVTDFELLSRDMRSIQTQLSSLVSSLSPQVDHRTNLSWPPDDDARVMGRAKRLIEKEVLDYIVLNKPRDKQEVESLINTRLQCYLPHILPNPLKRLTSEIMTKLFVDPP